MQSRTRRSTMFIPICVCLVAFVAFMFVGWPSMPSVLAGVTNTPTSAPTDTPEPTNTPEPTPTDTPEPSPTNTPEPTPTDTPEPPEDTPTPVPAPPEDTPTPAPTPTIPIVAPEAGARGGTNLLSGLWQVGIGLVLIGIALAWARRRRATTL